MTTHKVYMYVFVDDEGMSPDQAADAAVLRAHRAIGDHAAMQVAGQERMKRAVARERGTPPKALDVRGER